MSPADQDRQLEAITARRDTGRKKTDKLARLRPRPDQHGADVAAEHSRGRKREGGFIKDVGLERVRRELAPFVDDGNELSEPSPFDR